MEKFWATRKAEWFHGGHVWVHELMERYYLWEIEPMCDSFNKEVRSCNEWKVVVKRTYIEPDGRHITTCNESFAEADELPEEVAMELYEKVISNKYRLPAIKEMFEDAQYTTEAMRLMP